MNNNEMPKTPIDGTDPENPEGKNGGLPATVSEALENNTTIDPGAHSFGSLTENPEKEKPARNPSGRAANPWK